MLSLVFSLATGRRYEGASRTRTGDVAQAGRPDRPATMEENRTTASLHQASALGDAQKGNSRQSARKGKE